MGRIFGTDGVRGVANTELSCQLAMDIGRAAAMVVAERTGRKPVFVIGKDTRISSDMLQSALAAGLCSVGADVILLGVVPTPAVAYLVCHYGADAGVMLSASHNPFEFNGIKIFGSEGFKLSDDEEFEIEEIVLDHVLPYDLKWNDEIGRISTAKDPAQIYVNHLVSTVQGDLSGLRIAADCSNGSASATAARLFSQLGADVTLLNYQPNGININDHCGSTHMEHLAAFVRENKMDLGVAFDGDADRCLAVDENGDLVDGDRLIAIFAKHLKDEGKLWENTAVVTVMSNMGLFQFAKDNGIKTQTAKVGDRYVLELMRKHGYVVGGEQSGHVIFLEYMTTGDGQLSAIQLISIVKKLRRPLSQVASIMQVYPQVMLNVRADKEMKHKLDTDEGVQKTIEKYAKMLADNGRILVRASGTEPLIRVMVEGKHVDEIQSIAEIIAQTIKERLTVS